MSRSLEVEGRLQLDGPGCRVTLSGTGDAVEVRLSGLRGLPVLFRTYRTLQTSPVPTAMSDAGIRVRVRWGKWIPLRVKWGNSRSRA